MVQEAWAVDCETDPFKFDRVPRPFLWGAWNILDGTYIEFATSKDLVSYFRVRKCILYAHNGGRFDWHFVLDELEPATEIKIIGGRIAKFKIGLAEFRDSFSILPFALDKYKKTKIDYWKFEESVRQDHMAEIRSYLRDDCKNLAELVGRFIGQFGPKLTLAGAAMDYWSKKHDGNKGGSSHHFYKTLEPYYHGGRVECFRKGWGKGNFRVFDINSAYPFAMCHDHPIGTQIGEEQSIRVLTEDQLCRAFIKLTCSSVGAFPFRDGTGALSFPGDHVNRTFTVTGWEYVAARDLGLLDGRAIVHQVLTLEDTINFKSYVDEFFARKSAAKPQETDDQKAEYIFAKFMQNALSGKYGANPGPGLRGKGARYKEYVTCLPQEVLAKKLEDCQASPKCKEKCIPSPDDKRGCWSPVRREHNVVILARDLPKAKWRFYNVGTIASITGFIRAHLLRAIMASKNVMYCDTDSIVCETFGGTVGKALGEWACEGEHNEWAIGGKKLYAFRYNVPRIEDGKKITHKIASKGAKLTAKEITDIAKGQTITYKNDAPTFGVAGVKFVTRKIKMT